MKLHHLPLLALPSLAGARAAPATEEKAGQRATTNDYVTRHADER